MTTHGMTYHTTSVTGGYSVKQWKAANGEERELAQEVLLLEKKMLRPVRLIIPQKTKTNKKTPTL